MTRVLFRLCLLLGWGALLLGLILQYGIQDRVPGLSVLFYAMPKPCLLGLAVTLLVWPWAPKSSRVIAAITAIFLTLSWESSSWHRQVAESSDRMPHEEVRVLYWNLCRPTEKHQGMVDLVKEFQPHVAAFVEPGRGNLQAMCSTYESLLPGYSAAWMPRGILWLSRVPTRYRDRGKLEEIGAYARFDVNDLGPTFPVVVADVYPHAFHSREGQLQQALEKAQGRSDAILVGDFNTPLESALLEDYRALYTNAFEVAGSGFKETWPLGLPLLSLDHCWFGADWEVVEAKKLWRVTQSDHAALLVTLRRKKG